MFDAYISLMAAPLCSFCGLLWHFYALAVWRKHLMASYNRPKRMWYWRGVYWWEGIREGA